MYLLPLASWFPFYFAVSASRVGLDVSNTASGGITIRDSSNGLLNDQSLTSGKDAKDERVFAVN